MSICALLFWVAGSFCFVECTFCNWLWLWPPVKMCTSPITLKNGSINLVNIKTIILRPKTQVLTMSDFQAPWLPATGKMVPWPICTFIPPTTFVMSFLRWQVVSSFKHPVKHLLMKTIWIDIPRPPTLIIKLSANIFLFRRTAPFKTTKWFVCRISR